MFKCFHKRQTFFKHWRVNSDSMGILFRKRSKELIGLNFVADILARLALRVAHVINPLELDEKPILGVLDNVDITILSHCLAELKCRQILRELNKNDVFVVDDFFLFLIARNKPESSLTFHS